LRGALRGLGRDAVVAFALLSLTGCTTLRPIEDFSPSRIRAGVEVGDRVRIVTLADVRYDLKVTKVEADALYGIAKSGKHYKVMFEAMRTIEVEKVAGWKVATGVGTAIGVLAAAVVALLLYSLSRL